MKKITFILTMLTLAVATQAQSYDDIKGYMLLGQYKKAKDDVDKRMSNAKFASKPEAYMLKASIYAALGADSAAQMTPEGAALVAEAETAFQKYKEMDPSLGLLKDPVYKNAPINIYTFNFNRGYDQYKNQKWAESYAYFKKVAGYSDILGANQMLTTPVDTNVLVLAAFTAESMGDRKEAAQYYNRLADAKVAGPAYESVYRFLVTHSYENKDMAAFEKYRALGKSMYPDSEFFTYDQTDFAIGLEQNFEARLKAMEQVLAGTPNDYKANLSIAQIIYDTLYSQKEGAVQPANAAELEVKMVAALNKATAANQDNELAFLILGDHYINKSIRIDEKKDAFNKEVNKRTKPGAKVSAEDAAKRAEFDKQYGEAFDAAIAPYEKAAAIYAKKEKLSGIDKQQYKKAASYLGDIYLYKSEKAKGKPAEVTRLEGLAKKWNDLYVSIK